MAKNLSNPKKKINKMRASGFFLLSEDVIENILSRLPALSFASASCVSNCWNKVCVRILSRPKLASALSLNPSLHGAMKEVLDKVLSEPIVPHFVIACISKRFSLEETHELLTERFGERVPIITNAANGIIGLDAATDELREVRWETRDDEDNTNAEADSLLGRGIVLVVGYVPGLKVDAIPLLSSNEVPQTTFLDKFVTDIRNFTSSVSDVTSPSGIVLFGDRNVDMKHVLARMDWELHKETVIVGDASGCFLFTSVDDCHNNYGNMYLLDAVALVFAKDKNKSRDIGETEFHLTLSTGVMPFGPQLEAVCVLAKDRDYSWLTARIEGQYDLLDGEGLLTDMKEQFNEENFPDLYIGVAQQREYPAGPELRVLRTSSAFHEVIGGDKQFFVVKGVGIKPGNRFLFYHSDSDTALSSCGEAYRNLAILKSELKSKNNINPLKNVSDSGGSSSSSRSNTNTEEKEVFGALIFSGQSREKSWPPNVNSMPIHKNFPGIALAGAYCGREIGRGCQEDDEENSALCCVHYHSSVYLVLSYVQPTSSRY